MGGGTSRRLVPSMARPAGSYPPTGHPHTPSSLMQLSILLCVKHPSCQVEGITSDILRQALAQAGKGRRHILGEMAKCQPPPRQQLSKFAPQMARIKVSRGLGRICAERKAAAWAAPVCSA